MNKINFFLIGIAIMAISGCKDATVTKEMSTSIPGDCESSSAGNVICAPTFQSLAADLEGYNGKNILINGYVVID